MRDTATHSSPQPGLTTAAERFRTAAIAGLKPVWLEALLAMVLIGVLALTALFAVLKPSPDWDSLPYFALALQQPGDTAAEVHSKAYSAVREFTSAGDFERLSKGDDYRTRQYQDPAAFHSMLPMYAVKSGYIGTLRFLAPFVDISTAAFAIGLAALATIAIIMLWWMRQGGFLQAIPFVLPVLLMLQTREMVTGVTPDLPAAALIIAIVWMYSLRRDWIAALLLVVATTFRPDTLLFAFALLLAFAATRQRMMPVIVTFLACLIVQFVQTQAAGHMGWWPHYWFSNIKIQMTMEGFDPAFSVAAYLKGLARGLSTALAYFNWPVICMALAAAWALLARAKYKFEPRIVALLIAIILVLGGKFATFPLPDDRIYMAFLLAASMLLASVWKPKLI